MDNALSRYGRTTWESIKDFFGIRSGHEGLPRFENDSGEGVVAFEPGGWYSPSWLCHLTIAGERIFEYGCPCGTCGIVFRKLTSPVERVNDPEAVALLGELDDLPPGRVLRRLARVLAPGTYHPLVLEAPVRRIEPGTTEDYFATDVARLFPPGANSQEASSPGTPYYRLGSSDVLERTDMDGGHYRALVTAIIVPLHDPATLDRARIDYWRHQHERGAQLTALAVSVIDDQAPACGVRPGPSPYPYAEQLLFTSCLLDGHHRMQAAAELGVPVRILSLLSQENSLTTADEDVVAMLGSYLRRPVPYRPTGATPRRGAA